MLNEHIKHAGRTILATWSGSMYGDTYYDVSAVVTTLDEAITAVAEIRAAVAAECPHWEACSGDTVRLVSTAWSGNPVSVVLSFVSRSGV